MSFSWSGVRDFIMYLSHLLWARSMSAPAGLNPFGTKPTRMSAAAPRVSPFKLSTSLGVAPKPVRRSRWMVAASSSVVVSSPIPCSPCRWRLEGPGHPAGLGCAVFDPESDDLDEIVVERAGEERHPAALGSVEVAGQLVVDEARVGARVRGVDALPACGLGAGILRCHVDQVGVGGARLQQEPTGLTLRVVAAADRAGLIEDLTLNAVEGARVDGHRIAAGGGGLALHLDLVAILLLHTHHRRRVRGEPHLFLALPAHVAGEWADDRDEEAARQRTGVGVRIRWIARPDDSAVDPVLQRLQIGIELGIAVVDRMVDADRFDADQRATRRVVAAVRADRQVEFADAVHRPVGVARVAVRAAEALGLVRREIDVAIEDDQAVDLRAATPTDDHRLDGHRQRGGEERCKPPRSCHRAPGTTWTTGHVNVFSVGP